MLKYERLHSRTIKIKPPVVSSERITTLDTDKIEEENLNQKFLGYCNWSFSKDKRLNKDMAIEMFRIFERDKLPFYIRIFNEMPRTVLNEFLETNNINKSDVVKINKKLCKSSSMRVDIYN